MIYTQLFGTKVSDFIKNSNCDKGKWFIHNYLGRRKAISFKTL